MPFRAVFRHASASRAQAENLIIVAYSDCGKVGYGEGCPLRYVTGETVESGAAFVRKYAGSIIDSVTDAQSLRAWANTHREVIDQNPAAYCAIEIALTCWGRLAEFPSRNYWACLDSRAGFATLPCWVTRLPSLLVASVTGSRTFETSRSSYPSGT